MKSLKSSHTGDPLAIALISYPGRDIHLWNTPGNPNGTYNMPKPYSTSTNNRGTFKRPSCMVRTHRFLSHLSSLFQKDRVVQTYMFSSRLSCVITCHPRPTPPRLAQDLSTVSDSIMSFLPLSLADNATFSMLPSSNNHPLSPNWKDSRHMKTMSPSRV